MRFISPPDWQWMVTVQGCLVSANLRRGSNDSRGMYQVIRLDFSLSSFWLLLVKSCVSFRPTLPPPPPPPPPLPPHRSPPPLPPQRQLHQQRPPRPQESQDHPPSCLASHRTTSAASLLAAWRTPPASPSSRPPGVLPSSPQLRPRTASSCPRSSWCLSSSRTWRTS